MRSTRKIPNLFIVGAARSGTTVLWHYLKSNPQVLMPGDMLFKEPAFFSDLKRSKFKEFEEYMNIFKGFSDNHKWIGEASTAYLTDPVSAERIYSFNSNAKIIILLRNPVSRACSLYNWMVQQGYEYARTFEQALLLEKRRKGKKIPNFFEPEYYYNFMYFSSGLYYNQVERYKEHFKNNVLIVKFEKFISNIEIEYNKICQFLEIQPNPLVPIDSYQKNISHSVKSSIEQFLLRKLTRFYLTHQEDFIKIRKKGNEAEFSKKLLDKLRISMDSLKGVSHIGVIQRLRIYRITKKIAHKLYCNELKINLKSIEQRETIMKYGFKNKRLPRIKRKTASILKKKYERDILLLSEYTGMDFSDWII